MGKIDRIRILGLANSSYIKLNEIRIPNQFQFADLFMSILFHICVILNLLSPWLSLQYIFNTSTHQINHVFFANEKMSTCFVLMSAHYTLASSYLLRRRVTRQGTKHVLVRHQRSIYHIAAFQCIIPSCHSVNSLFSESLMIEMEVYLI